MIRLAAAIQPVAWPDLLVWVIRLRLWSATPPFWLIFFRRPERGRGSSRRLLLQREARDTDLRFGVNRA
jgi:hypothetical protein